MNNSLKYKEVEYSSPLPMEEPPTKKPNVNWERLLVPPRMRSSYWKFFGFPARQDGSMITKDVIVCKLCKGQMVYNRNTSNLKMHLGSRHKNALLSIELDEKELTKKSNLSKIYPKSDDISNIEVAESSCRNPDDFKTNEMIVSEDIYDNEISDIAIIFPTNEEMPQYEQTKTENIDLTELNDAVLNFIISDLLSPKIVEGKGFKNFVSVLINRTPALPNEKKITEEIIPNLYRTYKDHVYSTILSNSSSFISLSLEQWTSSDGSLCLSIYVYYLTNDEPILHTKLLTSVGFAGCETVEQWSSFLDSFFNEWSINIGSISAILYAFNNNELKEALKMKNIILLPCSLFLMQNLCFETCFQHPTVDEILIKCRSFIKYLQENKVELLEDDDEFSEGEKDENDFTFSCDQPEIWLTTYYMLRGILRRKRAIDEYLQLKNIEDPFSKTEWKHMKNILELLEPLKTVVLTLFEEKNSLVSLLKPMIWGITSSKFKIDSQDSILIKDLKNNIVSKLNDTYTGLDVEEFMQIATKLDPRFKTFGPDESTEIESQLMNLLTILVDEQGLCCSNNLSCRNGTKKKQSRLSGINVLFGSFRVDKEEQSNEEAIKMEIAAYRSENDAFLEDCPLEWWQGMNNKCPNLIKLTRKYHCVPAVILCGINQLKDYITFYNKRASLPVHIADSLLFLHLNK